MEVFVEKPLNVLAAGQANYKPAAATTPTTTTCCSRPAAPPTRQQVAGRRPALMSFTVGATAQFVALCNSSLAPSAGRRSPGRAGPDWAKQVAGDLQRRDGAPSRRSQDAGRHHVGLPVDSAAPEPVSSPICWRRTTDSYKVVISEPLPIERLLVHHLLNVVQRQPSHFCQSSPRAGGGRVS